MGTILTKLTTYATTQFYVHQGMRVTKLHKTLQFRQSSFLKPYIDLNTTKRQEPGTSELKKIFYLNLPINSCFGKTMKNLRCQKSLIMVTNDEQANCHCNKLNFNRFKIFKDDIVAVTMVKKTICKSKATYLGATMLEVSKLQLYKFHFEEEVPGYRKTLGYCTRTLIQSSLKLKMKRCIKTWKE